MLRTIKQRAVCAIFASLIGLSAGEVATAAPLSMPAASVLSPSAHIEQARYRPRPVKRRPVRRRHHGGNAGAAAAIGVFGAVLGAAIANSQRDEDYYPGPVYRGAPVYDPDPGYYEPNPGYGYEPAPVYRGGPVYREQRAYPEQRVYRPRPVQPQPRQVFQQPRPQPQPRVYQAPQPSGTARRPEAR